MSEERVGVCWRKFRSVLKESLGFFLKEFRFMLEEIQECGEGKFRISLEGS
jgi:hypothetical protein